MGVFWIDVKNNNGETPFFFANGSNHKEIAKYLLEKKREAEGQIPQENFSNKDDCIICLEPRNALYVLNPCGHMSLCELCSYNLTQQTNPKCPSCRKSVRDYTKVFYQAPPTKRPKIITNNILHDASKKTQNSEIFDKSKWEKLKSDVLKLFANLKESSSAGSLSSIYIKNMKYGLNQKLKEFSELNLEGQEDKIIKKKERFVKTIKNYISSLEIKEKSLNNAAKENANNLTLICKTETCLKILQDLNTAIIHIYKVHQITHSKIIIHCKFCKKHLLSHEKLKLHVALVHHDKKGFKCEFCFKEYSICGHGGLEKYVEAWKNK